MISDSEYRAVVEFLHREARLADEARYAEWLALWTDDAVYWVPATTDPAADPDKHLSHIYDNRGGLETRVKLLQTGHRYARSPRRRCAGSSPTSRWRRLRRASASLSRTLLSPSWRSRPSARCTGGSAARRTACAGWAASSGCAARRSC